MIAVTHGYTLSYRSKWEHPVFNSKQEAAVWAWMCDAAQWTDLAHTTKYGTVELHRGELIITERGISEDFGLVRHAVRDLIERMVKDGMIRRVLNRCPTRVGTVVKIVKYDDYQTIGRHISQPHIQPHIQPHNPEIATTQPERIDEENQEVEEILASSANHTIALQPTTHPTANPTKNNTKKENTKKEERERGCPAPVPAVIEALPPAAPAEPKATGTRLSPDWVLPKSWGEWALTEGATHDHIYRESEKFRDYWIAQAGKSARKADWLATWRNWVRRSLENQKGNRYGNRAYAPVEDRNGFAVLNRRLEERDRGSAGTELGIW